MKNGEGGGGEGSLMYGEVPENERKNMLRLNKTNAMHEEKTVLLFLPKEHTTLKQRRSNVITLKKTLFQRCVSAVIHHENTPI